MSSRAPTHTTTGTTSATKPTWSLAIHGGAGAISREFDPERAEYMRDLKLALEAGAAILRAGGSALDATVAAVRVMEDSPLFNAGIGSVLTSGGKHELDAGVMRGSDLASGAVAGVKTIKNPILLAQRVLDASPHVLLIADGAEAFASLHGLERVDNSYFTTPARLKIHQELMKQATKMEAQHLADSATGTIGAPTSSPAPPFIMQPILDHTSETMTHIEPSASPTPSSSSSFMSDVPPTSESLKEKKYGTVGAVALDLSGELATAVSTGGMSMKSFGRVGDSPIIGAGFYATKQVAVCCTGNGEAFLRCAVAKDVAALMEYKGLSVTAAADQAIANGERLLGSTDFEGGLIAVDAHGHVAMPYNSKGMYRGHVSATHEPHVQVWRD